MTKKLTISPSASSIKNTFYKIIHLKFRHDKSVTVFDIKDNPEQLKNLCHLDTCTDINGHKRTAQEGYKYKDTDYFFCSPIHAGQFFNDLEHNFCGLQTSNLDKSTESNKTSHTKHENDDDILLQLKSKRSIVFGDGEDILK
jgi:YHS domain-containing protein